MALILKNSGNGLARSSFEANVPWRSTDLRPNHQNFLSGKSQHLIEKAVNSFQKYQGGVRDSNEFKGELVNRVLKVPALFSDRHGLKASGLSCVGFPLRLFSKSHLLRQGLVLGLFQDYQQR